MQSVHICFILVFIIFCILIECNRSTTRLITINKYSNCSGEDNNPLYFNGNITKINSTNKYSVSGHIKFKGREVYPSPIEVCIFKNRLRYKKCLISMQLKNNFKLIDFSCKQLQNVVT